MIDQGKIIKLEGDDAWVQVEASDQCKSCGARIICAPNEGQAHTFIVKNNLGGKIGDRVSIEERGNLLLKLSFIQYGIPLIGFFAGVSLAIFIPLSINLIPRELLLFLSGLSGLILGGFISWKVSRKMAGKSGRLFKIGHIDISP